MLKLYNAADVYISCALSIFETYGKSPLEAIACGTPVIVPAWDGFPYYITSEYGYLTKVNFLEKSFVSPYQFACLDKKDCIEKINIILKSNCRIKPNLPNWAYYDYSIQRIKNLIQNLFERSTSKKFINNTKKNNNKIVSSLFSAGINEFFKFYEINTLEDLISKNEKGIFSNKFFQGQESILKILHHEIFSLMEIYPRASEETQKILTDGFFR